ncbi:MAG: hypothetical protein LBV80_09665 [Deltaproteobacteria bacterium]|jgi:alkyl hydroperoxide reductase subunit AhpF|nr:hypothetical protein [Deltaproteobacteria bacterium]
MQDYDHGDSNLQIPEKIIPDDQRASLRQMLDALSKTVELHTYAGEEVANSQNLMSRFTVQLTNELAECSARIKAVRHSAAEAKKLAGPAGLPSIGIKAEGAEHFALRMVGAPLEQEGVALIKAIRMVGSGENELSRAARQSLAKLTEPREIMVFGLGT